MSLDSRIIVFVHNQLQILYSELDILLNVETSKVAR
jgi:hypothetical protein